MPIFRYRGRNQKGKVISGELESLTRDTALNHINRLGVIPLSISEVKVTEDVLSLTRKIPWPRKKTRVDDIIMFCKQMFSLLKAGVAVNRAIRGIADNTPNPAFRDVLVDVSISLDAGRDLSSAMAQHGETFSELVISMIKMGESTGRLDLSFDQIGVYLSLEAESIKRVKSAFRYPMMVFFALLVAMVVINFLVIPQFAKAFNSFGAQLPWVTKLLIAMSNFFVNYWIFLFILIVGSVTWLRLYLNTPDGRYYWDRVKLKIPYVGSIVERATLARFARSFSMTASAGVPVLQSLYVIAAATDNSFMSDKIKKMRNHIERGESILRTAQNSGLFTPLVLQMIAVGEETGEMDRLMKEIAEFYESQVDFDLKKLSQSIEPALMGIMGIMVGVLAFGIFLPMWSLGEVVQGGGGGTH